MPIDVHAITCEQDGEQFILLFDDMNRSQVLRWLEIWAIDPEISLTDQTARQLIEQVLAAPQWNPEEPEKLLRGGRASKTNRTKNTHNLHELFG